ncbi:hypothetical protein IAT38_007870 [Cryptococcus sp. DSM 104549]
MMLKFDLKIACVLMAVVHQQAVAIPQIITPGGGFVPNPNAPTANGPALFDPTTGPTCDDIKQTTAPDCWLASVMCALAKCNRGFIESLVVDQERAGNSQTSLSVTAVILKVWDPDTLKEKDQHVTLADTGSGKGNDDSSIYVWWPSAIQAAIIKHGGSGIENGKFDEDGGLSFAALSYLTGKKSAYEMDSSKWWGMLKDHVDSSPMTVCTIHGKTKKLVDSHCYTAMTIAKDGDSDEDRKIKLHNPWGDTKDYKYSDIKSDISYINYLKNWDAYTG